MRCPLPRHRYRTGSRPPSGPTCEAAPIPVILAISRRRASPRPVSRRRPRCPDGGGSPKASRTRQVMVSVGNPKSGTCIGVSSRVHSISASRRPGASRFSLDTVGASRLRLPTRRNRNQARVRTWERGPPARKRAGGPPYAKAGETPAFPGSRHPRQRPGGGRPFVVSSKTARVRDQCALSGKRGPLHPIRRRVEKTHVGEGFPDSFDQILVEPHDVPVFPDPCRRGLIRSDSNPVAVLPPCPGLSRPQEKKHRTRARAPPARGSRGTAPPPRSPVRSPAAAGARPGPPPPSAR